MNIRNGKDDITTDHVDIQRIMRQYPELDSYKFDNLGKIHEYFKHTNKKFYEEEITNLSTTLYLFKDNEFIVENISKKKSLKILTKVHHQMVGKESFQ